MQRVRVKCDRHLKGQIRWTNVIICHMLMPPVYPLTQLFEFALPTANISFKKGKEHCFKKLSALWPLIFLLIPQLCKVSVFGQFKLD